TFSILAFMMASVDMLFIDVLLDLNMQKYELNVKRFGTISPKLIVPNLFTPISGQAL
ncbi:hypothetical protein LCGC14_1758400, partial [marine sediment metagenome]